MHPDHTPTRVYTTADVEKIDPLTLRVGDLVMRAGSQPGEFTARPVTWTQRGVDNAILGCPTQRYTLAGFTDVDGKEYELSQPQTFLLYVVRRPGR